MGRDVCERVCVCLFERESDHLDFTADSKTQRLPTIANKCVFSLLLFCCACSASTLSNACVCNVCVCVCVCVCARVFERGPDYIWTRFCCRQQLRFVCEIGKGEFGVVLKAEAHGLPGTTSGVCFVAVKTLKDNAIASDRKDFLSEAQLLSTMDHENVLGLVGVCLKDEPWLIVLEVGGVA